jgi:pimeloyl-ACP methyl ester carboxylesterase
MWQVLEVTGHPIALLEPPGGPPLGALIFLNDREGQPLRDDAAIAQLLGRHRLACFCLDAGPTWWSDRICPSFHPAHSAERWFIDDGLPAIERRWPIGPRMIALAGVGMGGQGALRLAFKHAERFPVVAALDAALDHYELYGEGTALDALYASREQCRQDSAALHIHPARQPKSIWFAADPHSRWFRGNDRLHEKLMALGVAHTFQAGPASLAQMLEFVGQALASESRRLL